MQATISDIAREAGVCIATVSRVLNSSATVSKETREKVEMAMRKFNYTPSEIARGLKNKSLKTIAIVVKKLTMNHHMRIAEEINRRFSELGYDVVMFETGYERDENISSFLKRMFNKNIDGIVFIGSSFQVLTNFHELTELFEKIPVVIANGWIEGTYGLLVDEENGTKSMVEYLKKKGRKRMVFFKCNDTESTQKKIKGFKESLDDSLVMDIVNTMDGVKYALEVLKPLENGIDAIMCEEDNLAIKVISTLQKSGIAVPGDIAVTGFNDSEYASLSYPAITSVDNKAIEQGQFCASLLERILSGKEVDIEKKVLKIIETDLVIRQST